MSPLSLICVGALINCVVALGDNSDAQRSHECVHRNCADGKEAVWMWTSTESVQMPKEVLHNDADAHIKMNKLLIQLTTVVILSEYNLGSAVESATQIRSISNIFQHPSYNRRLRLSLDNDIALVKMATPVVFSRILAPACLPSPGYDFAGQMGVTAGWGVKENGKPSQVLSAVSVPIISQRQCRKKLLMGLSIARIFLTDSMMCAGKDEGGADSCKGDSGGPLMVKDNMNRIVIAGVVSWGVGCARPNKPGIYTRVNHYLSWIQSETRDACFCA